MVGVLMAFVSWLMERFLGVISDDFGEFEAPQCEITGESAQAS